MAGEIRRFIPFPRVLTERERATEIKSAYFKATVQHFSHCINGISIGSVPFQICVM